MVFHKERCNRQDNTGRNEFSSKCDQFLESDHVYHAYIGHVTLGYTVRVYIYFYSWTIIFMKDLAVTQLHLLRQAIFQSGQKIGIIECAHVAWRNT